MKFFLGLYGTSVLIALIYLNIWGQYAYKGFAYNLGRGLFWPLFAFPVFGQIVGGLVLVVVLGLVLSRRS